MRILLVNTFHHFRGGDSTYTFHLNSLLRQRGHDVRFFAMNHEKNLECAESRFFVDRIDFEELNHDKSVLSGLRVLNRAIYSREARIKLRLLLSEWRPDVAHLQGIHGHITPSILTELERAKVPVVWTLHDFKLICPDTHLFCQGRVCEACQGGRFYYCALRSCKKDSLAASIVAALESYVHGLLSIRRRVGAFIAPSQFLKETFVRFGWPQAKIEVLTNFLPVSSFTSPQEPDRHHALYVGRMTKLKGLKTLLEATARVPRVQVKIAGGGQLESELRGLKESEGINNLSFEGIVDRRAARSLLEGAVFTVAPSEAYENCPYSVMESLAAARPVVGSRIGGLPELLLDGETGLLFAPGNVAGLSESMCRLWQDRKAAARMGRAARAFALATFGETAHYERLMQIYAGVRA